MFSRDGGINLILVGLGTARDIFSFADMVSVRGQEGLQLLACLCTARVTYSRFRFSFVLLFE